MSIRKKISILFIISLFLMVIIGLWIDKINSQRIEDLAKDKYLKISNEIFLNIDDKHRIGEIIDKYKLKILKNRPLNLFETIYHQKHTFGFISISQVNFEDEFIIHIKYLDDEYILKSEDEQNLKEKLTLNILVFLDIFLLIAIFLYILKLLSPLKKISDDINHFSKGNFSKRINIDSNDEIGTLSKTFNKMAYNIEELINTRERLLRDIGHELRTPIAKGKFIIEKFENSDNKELLRKIFQDLERLTNELIELEKLNVLTLNSSSFKAETLLVESLGKLYLDDESKIEIRAIDNFKIEGDLDYLTTALKNLLDNALKYAISFPIIVIIAENKITIQNRGNKLSKNIDYYLKPFTQELSQRDGFGLGLSIVDKILEKHNFNLRYEYKDSYNIFIVDFKHP